MTVATSSRRHTPRTKGTGAIGCMCCPDTARMPLLSALLPDSIIAACRRSSSLVSPPEQQSCGPISPLERGIRRVVNTTLTARLPEIWGEVTTACASDAKHYGVWDQHLMTAYHARYRKAGVTIYWHTDKRAACVYSQLKRCSSSEVAAMTQGVLRHCTEMAIERP